MLARLGLVATATCLVVAPARAERYLVHDQREYERARARVEAGDTITLAEGTWRDFEIVISGAGTADRPIAVTAQTPGKVFLTGQSSLRIGGRHVVVSGLVFRDGHSPRGEVIAFKVGSDDLAHDARVTETVIDNFSKPDRYDDDYWVGLYGRGNRFDHNHLVGKTNKGVTLAVRINTEESRDNGHRIDHNYFGPRPMLGSNGGETIRIGVSVYSMFTSGTIVENNIFDRCDGEVEIISSKSNGNVYRGNLFLRSRGTLTLRHGDDSLVERNVFLGRGKDHTGGIRVINRNQTVRDNYMEGLRGTGFASALTVMNGVPNSPVNRYVQVSNAHIGRNSVVDSAEVALGAGASAERTAAPVDSHMSANLFSGIADQPLFRIDADVSGIEFVGNVVEAGFGRGLPSGFARQSLGLKRAANGLLYPTRGALAKVGAPRDLSVPALSEVGVSWYPKPSEGDVFGHPGKVHTVATGDDTLFAAAATAAPGDILLLQPGEYRIDKSIPLDKPLTIRGAAGRSSTVLLARPSLIELHDGGNIRLENLTVDGSPAPDSIGSSLIRTGPEPIKLNMVIELAGVKVKNLKANASYNVITLGKNAFADRIVIRDSSFRDISGAVVSATAETEDFGQYNVEYLDMIGNDFENVGGPIAAVYRGGTDESTFGPTVTFRGNRVKNAGKAIAGGHSGTLFLHGVQTTRIEQNIFEDSGLVHIAHTVGTPSTELTDNTFRDTPAPRVEELNYAGEPRAVSTRNTIDGKTL
jgi:poly(beta-D-mannuronate) lyase